MNAPPDIAPRCPCCGQDVPDAPRLDSILTAAGWTGDKKRLFIILMSARGRFLKTSDLIEIMWSGQEDGGPERAEKVIYKYIHDIRRFLAGWPLAVEGQHRPGGAWRLVWNGGYALERAPKVAEAAE